MRIGIFEPVNLPLSLTNYTAAIQRELAEQAVEFVSFANDVQDLPDADLYWDPRVAGGIPPFLRLRDATKPVVVTVHGAAPMSCPPQEYFRNSLFAAYGIMQNAINLWKWRYFGNRYAAIITVSHYAKDEIVRHLHLPAEKVTPIYHGADTRLFRPAAPSAERPQYLLHVSQYQPKKNIRRLLSAYARCQAPNKPRLIAVVPGFPDEPVPEGVTIIRNTMRHEELAPLYSHALAFLFPSLHETFGMPIIEAMASGCPVLTSQDTACGEIAGKAALLVDPRSTADMARAIGVLIEDESMCRKLAEKGVQRAAEFTWRRSAQGHLAVFESALRKDAGT